MGATSADNEIAGAWTQIAGDAVHSRAIVVVALCPTVEVHAVYNSGYAPSALKGTASGTDGRLVARINATKVGNARWNSAGGASSKEGAETAAAVYNRWTAGRIEEFVETGGNILAATSLFPLGRIVGREGSAIDEEESDAEDDSGDSDGSNSKRKAATTRPPLYQIIHPDSVTPDGGLTFFAEVDEGEELTLMSGDVEQLVKLPPEEHSQRIKAPEMARSKVVGSLLTYCAGCMLQLGPDDHTALARRFVKTLRDASIFGMFSFGEQGTFRGQLNAQSSLGCHGNLMVSALLFCAPKTQGFGTGSTRSMYSTAPCAPSSHTSRASDTTAAPGLAVAQRGPDDQAAVAAAGQYSRRWARHSNHCLEHMLCIRLSPPRCLPPTSVSRQGQRLLTSGCRYQDGARACHEDGQE